VPNRIFAVLYVSVMGLTRCYKTTVFYIYLNYFMSYEGSQKSKIALWCCKSVTLLRTLSSVLKLLCISIHTPNYSCLSELLPEIWGGQKIQNSVAVVRMHQNHLAEKKFNTVEAPNHIYSCTKFQHSNSITSWDMDRSPLFAIGLTLRGPTPEMGFWGYSTRSGFLCRLCFWVFFG